MLVLRLASIEHDIHFGHVGLVVDDAAADFNPSVGLKRHLLSADYHLRGHAVPFEQARCGRGSLKAQNLFPVPDAGHIHGRADALNGVVLRLLGVERAIPNLAVKVGKVRARETADRTKAGSNTLSGKETT